MEFRYDAAEALRLERPLWIECVVRVLESRHELVLSGAGQDDVVRTNAYLRVYNVESTSCTLYSLRKRQSGGIGCRWFAHLASVGGLSEERALGCELEVAVGIDEHGRLSAEFEGDRRQMLRRSS